MDKERVTLIKHFTGEASAMVFAKKHRGYAEGPFMDASCNSSWSVYYQEGRTNG